MAIAATWSAGPEDETTRDGSSQQPTRIGRFTVLYELGSGSMGVVYAAYDSELDRKIAIKLVHDDARSGYEDRQRRLLREAQAMARLSHPNVVAVHEVGLHHRQVFVAMEFVEGLTLKAWLRRDPTRSWSEVLRTFCDAGKGLGAAHKAGLVHRDFKPENVLVGDGQRPRVLDFGLVRPADQNDDPTGRTIEGAPLLQSQSDVIRLRSSEVGLIVGTPAYMSPEQWLGGEIDARSDQFSFCAALYEALYDQLPFTGKTAQSISESVRSGKVKPPPSSTRVPSWVLRVITRGLARDPEDRWPSMLELITVLSVDPRRKRRLFIGALAASLGLAGLGYASASVGTAGARTCEQSALEMHGVWDSTSREATKRAFLDAGTPYAEEAWARIDTRLSSYADEWVAMRQDACVDHRDGLKSDSLFDLRSTCLDDRRRSLAAAVDVLASGAPEIAAGAVDLVAALPPLSRCADSAALLAAVPPPEDPEVAAAVATIDSALTRSAALENAGQYFEGLAITSPLLAEAEHLDYPPVLARTLVRQGSLEMESGQVAEAEAKLFEAIWIALEAGDEEVASEAIAKWAFVVGTIQARGSEAFSLKRLALVLAERASTSSRLPRLIYNNLGTVAHRQRDFSLARSFYRQALAAGERESEANPLDLAATLNNIGQSHSDERDNSSALPYFKRALLTYAEAAGDHHPYLAATLANTGAAEVGLGELESAHDHYQRSLRIFEESLGPTHVNLAYVHLGLGRVAIAQHTNIEAKHHLETAVKLWLESDGLVPELGDAHEELAVLHTADDDPAAALASLRRAVEIHAAVDPLGINHRRALIALADRMVLNDAASSARRLISDFVTDPMAEKLDDQAMADLDFALAKAIQEKEPARADALARGALKTHADSSDTSKRREIDAWLRQHNGLADGLL